MKATRHFFTILLLLVISVAAQHYHPSLPRNRRQTPKLSENDWLKAQNTLRAKKEIPFKNNIKTAKNIILFIGDGLSISTTTATRVYMGGEHVSLAYDKFEYFGLSKTYCVDRQVTDSASGTTALLTGVKNNYGVIGLSANVTRGQCTYTNNDVLYNIVKWAQDSGKATGIVTTSSVTDATAASAYAHVPNREWEYEVPEKCRQKTLDIADQLVNSLEGSKLKVILGGGRRNFIPTTTTDEEGTKGLRKDKRNLINEWIQKQSKAGRTKYIWNKSQLDEISPAKTDYLMGLFEPNHCMYNLDVIARKKQNTEPSLSDMTEIAVNILKKNSKGFFLLVEGGRIDHAHHENYARKALDETAEFSKAVEIARSMTNQDDTLVVVTGDHSNVMTMSGYPPLQNDILGLSTFFGNDKLPYETLSYANGPGYARTYGPNGRNDMTNDNFKDINRRYSATVPLKMSSHGGDDVGVYASGPWAHLFTGSYEQNEIPIAMAYAAKIGPYKL